MKPSSTWPHSLQKRHSYNCASVGCLIVHRPQDMAASQVTIWPGRPEFITESGIAHGGLLVFSASLLALLDYYEAVERGKTLDPCVTRRRVIGIYIDIRVNNRAVIELHPMAHRIDLIEGYSIDPVIIAQVQETAKRHNRVMVILVCNHTHDHVLAELEAYAPLTSLGSYCIVLGTVLGDLPDDMFLDRPWGKGNNPKTAVWQYLRRLNEEGRTAIDRAPLTFEINKMIEGKLLMTVAPDGYLKRV